jgi:thymidine kinase
LSEKPKQHSPGRIEVICGCMFVGKTARLIERLDEARAAGRRVIAFKHAYDDRYDPGYLATHDDKRFPAITVPDAAQILAQYAGAEVVGIDEAQFFGRDLVDVCRAIMARGQHVLVVGIDHDAWGRPFPPLPQLKDMADDVELRHTPCTVCGRPARYSQRMVPVTDERMVGGPEAYEPRCAACFRPLPPPAPEY